MKKTIFVLFSLLLSAFCFAADYAAKSVLSEGKWVQLKVTETAIYKLTYEQIKGMGFSDPAKIKIYGYGGYILDQDFNQPYIDDLPETAVYLHKGDDGIFNANDFLLFFGRGLTKWTYEKNDSSYHHQNNPYSLYASYFITENAEGPKVIPVQNSFSPTTAETSVFDDYYLYEKDLVAILHSGRELFGESFTAKNSQSFTYNIPGITNNDGRVRLSFAASHTTKNNPAPITLSINNSQPPNISGAIENVSASYEKAKLFNQTRKWIGDKPENGTLTIQYQAGYSSLAHLNYFTLNVKRNLRFYDTGYTLFREISNTRADLKYRIANASAHHQIWNISDAANICKVETQLVGNEMVFGAKKVDKPTEYVMIDPNKSFPTPEIVSDVANQNLHQLPQTDMVIIAPKAYFDFAEQLAEKHREKQGLHVTVVRPEWIYNEFSSGTPDVTAYRRFMKMFYDRATTTAEKPRYLLLYGDANFNNRQINPEYYLLSYQFEESLDERISYGTDDYFGFLDNNEGVNLGSSVLDIGIGRFPVNTSEQAANALKKVSNYMENNIHGTWKNTVIFTSDDTGADDSFCTFGKQANALAKSVETQYPRYIVAKSYMDGAQSTLVNGKKNYPSVKKKLMNTLRDGCFLFNYTGHGSPTAMSSEDMMHISDIRLMNFPCLPLWITATCDFGWFDDDTNSAGEEVFLNPTSAGIALITTTRVVYASDNQRLNHALIDNVFRKNADGSRPTLGDIIKKSKVSMSTDFNKLNFMLFGDPALQLNYPEWTVQLESINGAPFKATEELTFNALEEVYLEGSIVDDNGNVLDDFNGDLITTAFDGKNRFFSTITRSETRKPEDWTQEMADDEFSDKKNVWWTFYDYPNTIFQGNGNIENGRFSMGFTIPLDIANRQTLGKMNFYAIDKEQSIEAAGYFQNYMLYGVNENYVMTEDGPTIHIAYLNSSDFRNGDTVNETPFFYAEIFDEDGINYTGSGMGHDITITVDRNPAWTWSFPLNRLFFPSGNRLEPDTVYFTLPELPNGEHVLDFKAWDILNNSNSISLQFKVANGYKPNIYTLKAFPNPAVEETHFYIQHNRPGDEMPLEVEIRVYDLTGRMLWSHSESTYTGFRSDWGYTWDLRTNNGEKLSSGLYLYQATIKTKGGKESTKAERLIVR